MAEVSFLPSANTRKRASATKEFFYYFLMSNVLMSKTNRRHFYLVLNSPLSHTKKTQNREMAFVCVLIRTHAKTLKTWYARSNVSLEEGNIVQRKNAVGNTRPPARSLFFYRNPDEKHFFYLA